jgi:hypothetical protein
MRPRFRWSSKASTGRLDYSMEVGSVKAPSSHLGSRDASSD